MIKVTMKDGKVRWIAVQHVCHIGGSHEDPSYVTIYFAGGNMITVQEQLDNLAHRINRKIVEPIA